MINSEVAQSVIEQMTTQIDLFISLSLGICGGLLLLAMQILFHNQDTSKRPVAVRHFYLWFLSFLSEGASICTGALSRSAVTSVIPAIFQIKFASVRNWTHADFEGAAQVRISAIFQFSLFFLGIILIFLFVLANRELMRGVSSVAQPKK